MSSIATTDLSETFTASMTSPLGDLVIEFSDSTGTPHIHALSYHSSSDSQVSDTTHHTVMPALWTQRITSYFLGDTQALNELPIHLLTGTAFQQQVWLALRHIPAGNTWSYKDIAAYIDRPKAVRAVGQALSKNPLPLILPCHRVIKTSGQLGGYAGNSEIGNMRKRFLLWHEGQLDAEPLQLAY